MNFTQKPSAKFLVNQSAQILSNLIGIRLHLNLEAFRLESNPVKINQDAGWMALTIHWKRFSGETLLLFRSRDMLMMFPHLSDSQDLYTMELCSLVKRYLQFLASHLSFFSSELWEIDEFDIKPAYELLKNLDQSLYQANRLQIQIASDLVVEGYFMTESALGEIWHQTLKEEHVIEMKSLAFVDPYRSGRGDEKYGVQTGIMSGGVDLNTKLIRDMQPYAILPYNPENNNQVFLFYNHLKIAEGEILEWGDPVQIQVTSITENGHKVLSHWHAV